MGEIIETCSLLHYGDLPLQQDMSQEACDGFIMKPKTDEICCLIQLTFCH
jgi:hypothetical protein